MAAVSRVFCRSMMSFSRQKSYKNLDRVCARFMGQHTRAVAPSILNKEQARAFVLHLDDRARILLKDQLHEIEKREVLQYLEEEIDQIEAGIKAAHEEVPESEKKKKVMVTKQELWEVAVYNGFPFIGFGFLDNLIMILAGEWIDVTLGVALGISTMAAAGLGNLVSDVAGIASAGYVEAYASKIGVKTPDLTKEQAKQWQTRWATAVGRTVGICVGCLLGMFPLLFFPSQSEREQKKKDELLAAMEKERAKANDNNPIDSSTSVSPASATVPTSSHSLVQGSSSSSQDNSTTKTHS